jgi:hypothetical protein
MNSDIILTCILVLRATAHKGHISMYLFVFRLRFHAHMYLLIRGSNNVIFTFILVIDAACLEKKLIKVTLVYKGHSREHRNVPRNN